jgi:L-lactate dehydrogenase complex protein LldG
MAQTAREEILSRLRSAPPSEAVPRPAVPPLRELSWDRQTMIEKFAENIALQTGVVHRAADHRAAAESLTLIARQEGFRKVIASTDEVIRPLGLAGWGEKNGIEVRTASDYADQKDYKQAVFCEVEAGITGVDCALAETGTLVLAHGKHQPRLVSLAPLAHVAVVPTDRLFISYETALEKIFGGEKPPPSQLTFVSGPSMSADIQAVSFRGMHGPGKVFVILIG